MQGISNDDQPLSPVTPLVSSLASTVIPNPSFLDFLCPRMFITIKSILLIFWRMCSMCMRTGTGISCMRDDYIIISCMRDDILL